MNPRPVYPTEAELQRMSWHARERLQRRLRANQRPTDEEPPTRPDDIRDYSDGWITKCHRLYTCGQRTPAIEAGEREYHRRLKARQRERARTGNPRRGPAPGNWSIDQAIHLREVKGLMWREIGDIIGVPGESVRKRVLRHLDRIAAAKDQEQGDAA